jgi:haloalkane dehalogenase
MIELIRTPEERFYGLPGYPYDPHYVEINGARMHYLDEGEGEVILCLHGHPTWSYVYRKLIPTLKKNYRVIAPDFFGFGRSDKYTQTKEYSFYMHYRTMLRFLEKTELKNITLVMHDWGGIIGLSLVGKRPELFKRLVFLNSPSPKLKEGLSLRFRLWKNMSRLLPKFPIRNVIKWGSYRTPKAQTLAGYEAPYDNESYKTALKILPSLIPISKNDSGAKQLNRAADVLRSWENPAIIIRSEYDNVNQNAAEWFRENVPSIKEEPEVVIERAGHFIQEDQGTKVAKYIVDFMERSLARERGETVELDPKRYPRAKK